MICHNETNTESRSGIAEVVLLFYQFKFDNKLYACPGLLINNCDKTFYEVRRLPVIVIFFKVFPLAYSQYK